jgi:hypothetical protein
MQPTTRATRSAIGSYFSTRSWRLLRHDSLSRTPLQLTTSLGPDKPSKWVHHNLGHVPDMAVHSTDQRLRRNKLATALDSTQTHTHYLFDEMPNRRHTDTTQTWHESQYAMKLVVCLIYSCRLRIYWKNPFLVLELIAESITISL